MSVAFFYQIYRSSATKLFQNDPLIKSLINRKILLYKTDPFIYIICVLMYQKSVYINLN